MIDEYRILGRAPLKILGTTDHLSGKTILVTGAGGSIGSVICTELVSSGAQVIMLDHDETRLRDTQLACYGTAFSGDTAMLCDIRDRPWLTSIIRQTKPHTVIHAAALKHQIMLERFPLEAWKTNIIGTMNVVEACILTGVERLVNVSTDKAASPTCVLGSSKLIGEMLTVWASLKAPSSSWCSVRLGNVLGSRGSVLETFTYQAIRGIPLTVSSPRATRFFISATEAAHTILEACRGDWDGETVLVRMGEQLSIDRIASQVIEMTGSRSAIKYTRLEPGEKTREDLTSPSEIITKCEYNDLLDHVLVSPLSSALIPSTIGSRSVVDEMRGLIGRRERG